MLLFKLESEEISYKTKIITLQVKKGSDIKLWHSWDFASEEAMISDFVTWFLQEKDKIIVGFNILKFDIPLLLMKSVSMADFEKFSMKLNRSNILDLFVILTFQRRGNIKGFQDYCKEFGIETACRDEILSLYANKQYSELDGLLVKNLTALERLFETVVEKEK